VEEVGKVPPDDFLFQGLEMEGSSGALLAESGTIGGLEAVGGELIAEPMKAFGLQIETKELDGVGVGQVECGIVVEAGKPGRPILPLEGGEKGIEIGDGDIGMVFDGLPEMFGGIVSGAVKRNAFGDRVPVGKDSRGNGRRGAPTVDCVFPLLLHGDERVGVSGWGVFFDLREGLTEFVFGVSEERFKGPLVGHGDHAALDATTKEFAGELLALGVVEGGVAGPAASLRVDVSEELREGFKFDESVKSEGDRVTVLGDDRGWRNENLKGDGLGR